MHHTLPATPIALPISWIFLLPHLPLSTPISPLRSLKAAVRGKNNEVLYGGLNKLSHAIKHLYVIFPSRRP